jgi:hypothetical protein
VDHRPLEHPAQRLDDLEAVGLVAHAGGHDAARVGVEAPDVDARAEHGGAVRVAALGQRQQSPGKALKEFPGDLRA